MNIPYFQLPNVCESSVRRSAEGKLRRNKSVWVCGVSVCVCVCVCVKICDMININVDVIILVPRVPG